MTKRSTPLLYDQPRRLFWSSPCRGRSPARGSRGDYGPRNALRSATAPTG
jgi:hypothetical protein